MCEALKADEAPPELTIGEGIVAGDGGTSYLWVRIGGCETVLYLGWSIGAQREGGTLFAVDGREVSKRSPEEAAWVSRLRGAAERETNPDRRAFAEGLADRIESETHARTGPPSTKDPLEEARRLIREGRRVEAMAAYRAAHPGARPAEARAAMERLAEG